MSMCGGLQGAPGRAQGDPDRDHTLLCAVLDEIPDPIVLKDREGRVLMANRAALDVMTRMGVASTILLPAHLTMQSRYCGSRRNLDPVPLSSQSR